MVGATSVRTLMYIVFFLLLSLSSCGQVDTAGSVGPRTGANQRPMDQRPQTDSSIGGQDQIAAPAPEALPPPTNIAPIRPVPGVPVAYDFIGTLPREGQTAAVARMVIQNGILQTAKRVNVKGTLVNLRSSSQRQPLDRTVDVLSGGVIDFTVQNLKPDTVYRIEGITVSDVTGANQQAGNAVTIKDPYFLATTSDTKLSKARRRLALQALSEAYDWDKRNYDSTKGYARGWGWCDYFYTWAVSKEFNARAGSGSTYFFRRYNALGDANQIPSIAPNASLAGDLIRYEGTSEGTHTFMIIAYDADTQSLWNVEGNYNSRVMRSQRKIRSNWMHGHLTESQVK